MRSFEHVQTDPVVFALGVEKLATLQCAAAA